jgi:hypothetical protein
MFLRLPVGVPRVFDSVKKLSVKNNGSEKLWIFDGLLNFAGKDSQVVHTVLTLWKMPMRRSF